MRWKKGQAPRMDTGMVSRCAHPHPGVLMAGRSETGPWCQMLVQNPAMEQQPGSHPSQTNPPSAEREMDIYVHKEE